MPAIWQEDPHPPWRARSSRPLWAAEAPSWRLLVVSGRASELGCHNKTPSATGQTIGLRFRAAPEARTGDQGASVVRFWRGPFSWLADRPRGAARLLLWSCGEQCVYSRKLPLQWTPGRSELMPDARVTRKENQMSGRTLRLSPGEKPSDPKLEKQDSKDVKMK